MDLKSAGAEFGLQSQYWSKGFITPPPPFKVVHTATDQEPTVLYSASNQISQEDRINTKVKNGLTNPPILEELPHEGKIVNRVK